MQNLPPADIYRLEFEFMPWGKLIEQVTNCVVASVPQNGSVLDLMCGPGYLAQRILSVRPDIEYLGVDLDQSYLQKAAEACPTANFEYADVRFWIAKKKFDAVLCTAGVHHLPDEHQEIFIGKISDMVMPGKFAIIADPYIDDYKTNIERMLASAKLGYEYLHETIQRGAPREVIEAAIQLIPNDIFQVEWKTSVEKRLPQLKAAFKNVVGWRTWPGTGISTPGGYGDHYFICKN